MIYGIAVVLLAIGISQAAMIFLLITVNDRLLTGHRAMEDTINRQSNVMIQQHAHIERLLDERRSLFAAAFEEAKSDATPTAETHAPITIDAAAEPHDGAADPA